MPRMPLLDRIQLDFAIRVAAKLPTRPQPLITFHLFPNLPAELRLKIWEAGCIPRVLTILTCNPNASTNEITFYTPSPPPNILSVSHEARSQALRTYHLSFSTSSSPPATYFNPYLDTLYLPRHRDMGYDDVLRDFQGLVKDEDKNWLDHTRSVALDVVDAEVKRPWESYNKAQLLRGFRNLEEVVIVCNNDSSWIADLRVKYSMGGEILMVEPSEDPKNMLWAWAMFRNSFMAEERFIEEACQDSGVDYHRVNLPTIRVKQRLITKIKGC